MRLSFSEFLCLKGTTIGLFVAITLSSNVFASRTRNIEVDKVLSDPRHLHVRMFYEPSKMSIRNANGATGDGRFSTSGPCGGVNAFSTDPSRIAAVKVSEEAFYNVP